MRHPSKDELSLKYQHVFNDCNKYQTTADMENMPLVDMLFLGDGISKNGIKTLAIGTVFPYSEVPTFSWILVCIKLLAPVRFYRLEQRSRHKDFLFLLPSLPLTCFCGFGYVT